MSITRRGFVRGSAVVGGGLVIGFHLQGCSKIPLPHVSTTDLQPNAFLQVTPQGVVVLQLHKAEMGQGVLMGMATLVGEELNLTPGKIRIEHAHVHPDFGDPEMKMMMTGGSSSMRNSFEPIRRAAAMVRVLLLSAAAAEWGMQDADLRLEQGRVVATIDGREASMGDFVARARQLPLPDAERLPLKSAGEFAYIGRSRPRVDALAKSNGTAVFGLDIAPANTLVAVMRRCPHLGGDVVRFVASDARKVDGVREVMYVNGGIAVVADSYWAARKAADLVDIEWDKGPLAGLSSAGLLAHHRKLLAEQKGRKVREDGDADLASGETLAVEYHVPLLSHAPMEPPNALVSVTEDRVEIWTGTQVPDTVLGAVAAALRRPREQVVVNNHLLGGGFGRRLIPDYVVEAALIAEKLAAENVRQPLRLVWSREDDIRHDYYRPAATVNLSATVAEGRVTSISGKVVCPSLYGNLMPMYAEAMAPQWLPPVIPRTLAGLAKLADSSMTEGLGDTDYRFPYFRIDAVRDDTPIPVGFWRSVGHSQNAFFMEGFVDELAHRTGTDPVAFRLAHLPTDSRRFRALQMAAEKANWGSAPQGQFQGVAVHESFKSVVAQVANVSVDGGEIRVHKIVCVVDCGRAVNPDVVVAQMEGGVVFGLTAALKSGITLEDGAVQQSNFHDYPVLRMYETPEIEVHVLDSDAHPTGVGEPGVPPVAPAVANAVFAATGQRLRELPLKLA